MTSQLALTLGAPPSPPPEGLEAVTLALRRLRILSDRPSDRELAEAAEGALQEIRAVGKRSGPDPEADARMRQLTLDQALVFLRHELPTRWQHRKGDPESSRISAAIGTRFRPSMRARLLVAAVRIGPATVREIAAAAGLDYHPAEKRFSDLKRLGLVEGTGELTESEVGGTPEIYRACVEEDRG